MMFSDYVDWSSRRSEDSLMTYLFTFADVKMLRKCGKLLLAPGTRNSASSYSYLTANSRHQTADLRQLQTADIRQLQAADTRQLRTASNVAWRKGEESVKGISPRYLSHFWVILAETLWRGRYSILSETSDITFQLLGLTLELQWP